MSQLAVGCTLQGSQLGGLTSQGKLHEYRIGRAIGAGGFGQTYLARDLSTGERIAVKEYYPSAYGLTRLANGYVQPYPYTMQVYEEGRKEFIHEATLLNQVRDVPSAVHVSDFFNAFGTSYMVMDYVEGMTLQKLVETKGRANPHDLLMNMLPLIDDLHRLHAKNVIHRDINPSNIILQRKAGSGDTVLRIIDFGCAKSLDMQQMTVVLTPGFAPIEQYSDVPEQGSFTDVYSICATIYYCITTLVPPNAEERYNAINSGQSDPLKWPAHVIPIQAEQLIMRGLAVRHQERIQSMRELSDGLRSVLGQPPEPSKPPAIVQATVTPQPTPTTDIWDWAYKNSTVIAIVVFIIMLILVFTFI